MVHSLCGNQKSYAVKTFDSTFTFMWHVNRILPQMDSLYKPKLLMFHFMIKGNRKTFLVVLADWPSRASWHNLLYKNWIKVSGGVCVVRLGRQQQLPRGLHIYETPAIFYYVCKKVIFIYIDILFAYCCPFSMYAYILTFCYRLLKRHLSNGESESIEYFQNIF